MKCSFTCLAISEDADRTINEYKKKLKKAEQDTERAQERIRSLELQVEDLRHEVERLDRSEKEARKEKRRIEAEVSPTPFDTLYIWFTHILNAIHFSTRNAMKESRKQSERMSICTSGSKS